MTTNNTIPDLKQAPEDVQLAVDLIYLLESNEIPIERVLSALKIVERDFQKKREQNNKK